MALTHFIVQMIILNEITFYSKMAGVATSYFKPGALRDLRHWGGGTIFVVRRPIHASSVLTKVRVLASPAFLEHIWTPTSCAVGRWWCFIRFDVTEAGCVSTRHGWWY